MLIKLAERIESGLSFDEADTEFARGSKIWKYERDTVRRALDKGNLTGRLPDRKPPIHLPDYASKARAYDAATERGVARARKIHKRFVEPRQEKNRRFLADRVARMRAK